VTTTPDVARAEELVDALFEGAFESEDQHPTMAGARKMDAARTSLLALVADLARRAERSEAGIRDALGIIRRASEILNVDWERLDRNDLLTLMSRTLSFLDNGPEMVRACVVASIPREEPTP